MSEERLIVISADGHAGGDIHDYRPYLASKWHDDFDAWAKDFVNPHEDLIGDATGILTVECVTLKQTAKQPKSSSQTPSRRSIRTRHSPLSRQR